ncbi:hypothetical protein CB0940_03851 [Cercospora beticola]|uniref:Uncharacterized protein n=1 Tax=Cercospora beticola TaxID=122368 RepID=A0A2G5HL01_CERBT|nr:hypothetical protein CB0940_03851 [Cercospora beticola]PIA92892.1 hypothetical protein CB0940_03851 [Cercospora beticola]WPB01051.1 hypothetical protein RHO25_005671 [Cercospora beticola]
MSYLGRSLLLLAPLSYSALGQYLAPAGFTIPATNGSLPSPAGDGNACAEGFFPGRDETIVTIPYTYAQVIGVVGNFTNLVWAGSPPDSVSTNASASTLSDNNWQPGDARFYELQGATVIESLVTYSRPAVDGPYVEVHTLAPLGITLPGGVNISSYADFDGQVWEGVCDGRAVQANFTTVFCATDATVAGAAFKAIHGESVLEVGRMLGGQNFTSCDALNAAAGGSNTTTSPEISTGGSATLRTSFRCLVPIAIAVMSYIWL